MAGATGMLKECAANHGKFTALQQSIQSYLESIKGAKAEGAVITDALASAGRVLDGPQDELVLQPLRLAVETKHVKLVEPALDCLHEIEQKASGQHGVTMQEDPNQTPNTN